MRYGYDGITPEALPRGAAIYASYIDGHWPNFHKLAGLFPGAIHLSIAADPAHDADILDCETGDATPAQCPDWVNRQRARGAPGIVYSNTSTWPQIVYQFNSRRLPTPLWWGAQYDGKAQMLPGSIGKQYLNTPGWDRSVFADFIPGIDPTPDPHLPAPPPPPKEVDMLTDWIVADPKGGYWLIAHDMSAKISLAGTDLAALQSAHDGDGKPIYGSGLALSDEFMATIPTTTATQ